MKKIMFNDKFRLTQAVLEGRKTMTRRIVPDRLLKDCVVIGEVLIKSPYKVGEVVAVAQSYNDIYEELKRTHGSSSSITRDFFHKYIQGGRMPVSNKMFVKSDAMIKQIKITDIKVERLQDISDEDCLKEGIFVDYDEHGGMYATPFYDYKGNDGDGFFTPQEAFAALINKVSGKGTWERNPWVFAYTFELVK